MSVELIHHQLCCISHPQLVNATNYPICLIQSNCFHPNSNVDRFCPSFLMKYPHPLSSMISPVVVNIVMAHNHNYTIVPSLLLTSLRVMMMLVRLRVLINCDLPFQLLTVNWRVSINYVLFNQIPAQIKS
jgi:hypothetical protein